MRTRSLCLSRGNGLKIQTGWPISSSTNISKLWSFPPKSGCKMPPAKSWLSDARNSMANYFFWRCWTTRSRHVTKMKTAFSGERSCAWIWMHHSISTQRWRAGSTRFLRTSFNRCCHATVSSESRVSTMRSLISWKTTKTSLFNRPIFQNRAFWNRVWSRHHLSAKIVRMASIICPT